MPASHPSAQRGFSGLQPYTGPWTDNEVLHLVRRTLFGAKVEDVQFFRSMTMSEAVDYLLTVPAEQPAPPLKTYSNSTTPGDPDAGIPTGNTWVNTNTTAGNINGQRRQSLKLVDGPSGQFRKKHPGKNDAFLAQSFCYGNYRYW